MDVFEPVSETTLASERAARLPALSAQRLEARRIDLALDVDGVLTAGPAELLTLDDHRAIRHWRHHLAALVTCVDRDGWQAAD